MLRFVLYISLASCSRVAQVYPIQRLLVKFQPMLSFSLWLNPCPVFQESFYTEAEEVEKDVTINVTNEFDPYDDYCRRSNNVRHVDRSGLPQFTATDSEETVIGLNESREVCFATLKRLGGSTMFLSNS